MRVKLLSERLLAWRDTQGRYALNNLPPGNYTVQGVGNGLQSKPSPVALTADKPATADVALTDKQGDAIPNGWIRTPGRVAGPPRRTDPAGAGHLPAAAGAARPPPVPDWPL